MYTVRRARSEDLWTVGYFEPHADSDGEWHEWRPLEDFNNRYSAFAFINYLNGGTGEEFVAPSLKRRLGPGGEIDSPFTVEPE